MFFIDRFFIIHLMTSSQEWWKSKINPKVNPRKRKARLKQPSKFSFFFVIAASLSSYSIRLDTFVYQRWNSKLNMFYILLNLNLIVLLWFLFFYSNSRNFKLLSFGEEAEEDEEENTKIVEVRFFLMIRSIKYLTAMCILPICLYEDTQKINAHAVH